MSANGTTASNTYDQTQEAWLEQIAKILESLILERSQADENLNEANENNASNTGNTFTDTDTHNSNDNSIQNKLSSIKLRALDKLLRFLLPVPAFSNQRHRISLSSISSSANLPPPPFQSKSDLVIDEHKFRSPASTGLIGNSGVSLGRARLSGSLGNETMESTAYLSKLRDRAYGYDSSTSKSSVQIPSNKKFLNHPFPYSLWRCLRALLLDPDTNIRLKALRCVRLSLKFEKENYIVDSSNIKSYYDQMNFDILISRALQRQSTDKYLFFERFEALRLVLYLLRMESGRRCTRTIVSTLVAIADEPMDKFWLVCIDLLRELVVEQTELACSCNVIQKLVDALLNPKAQRLSERIIYVLLQVLDSDSGRRYVSSLDIYRILSIFTNTTLMPSDLGNDAERVCNMAVLCNANDERRGRYKHETRQRDVRYNRRVVAAHAAAAARHGGDLRKEGYRNVDGNLKGSDSFNLARIDEQIWKCGRRAFMLMMRSLTGILYFSSNKYGIRSLVNILILPSSIEGTSNTRVIILETFRKLIAFIKSPQSRVQMQKYRQQNLLQNYLVFLLISFFENGLFDALVEISLKDDNKDIADNARFLLTQIFQISSQLLPTFINKKFNVLSSVVSNAFPCNVTLVTSGGNEINLLTSILPESNVVGYISSNYRSLISPQIMSIAQLNKVMRKYTRSLAIINDLVKNEKVGINEKLKCTLVRNSLLTPSKQYKRSFMNRIELLAFMADINSNLIRYRPLLANLDQTLLKRDLNRLMPLSPLKFAFSEESIDKASTETFLSSALTQQIDDYINIQDINYKLSKASYFTNTLKQQLFEDIKSGKYSEEKLGNLMKQTNVFSSRSYENWKVNNILSLVEGPLSSMPVLMLGIRNKFFKRVLLGLISDEVLSLPWNINSLIYIQIISHVFRILCRSIDETETKLDQFTELLNRILDEILLQYKYNCDEEVKSYEYLEHNKQHLTINKFSTSLYREYCTLIGIASQFSFGSILIQNHKIFRFLIESKKEELYPSDYLTRILLLKLDYRNNELQKILQNLLTIGSGPLKLHIIQHLKSLYQVKLPNFLDQALELLISQLNQPAKTISDEILQVLEEIICDKNENSFIEQIVKLNPDFSQVYSRAGFIFSKFLETPLGFEYLKQIGQVEPQIRQQCENKCFGNIHWLDCLENSISFCFNNHSFTERSKNYHFNAQNQNQNSVYTLKADENDKNKFRGDEPPQFSLENDEFGFVNEQENRYMLSGCETDENGAQIQAISNKDYDYSFNTGQMSPSSFSAGLSDRISGVNTISNAGRTSSTGLAKITSESQRKRKNIGDKSFRLSNVSLVNKNKASMNDNRANSNCNNSNSSVLVKYSTRRRYMHTEWMHTLSYEKMINAFDNRSIIENEIYLDRLQTLPQHIHISFQSCLVSTGTLVKTNILDSINGETHNQNNDTEIGPAATPTTQVQTSLKEVPLIDTYFVRNKKIGNKSYGSVVHACILGQFGSTKSIPVLANDDIKVKLFVGEEKYKYSSDVFREQVCTPHDRLSLTNETCILIKDKCIWEFEIIPHTRLSSKTQGAYATIMVYLSSVSFMINRPFLSPKVSDDKQVQSCQDAFITPTLHLFGQLALTESGRELLQQYKCIQMLESSIKDSKMEFEKDNKNINFNEQKISVTNLEKSEKEKISRSPINSNRRNTETYTGGSFSSSRNSLFQQQGVCSCQILYDDRDSIIRASIQAVGMIIVNNGYELIKPTNLIEHICYLSMNSKTLSIRATCFYVIGLISKHSECRKLLNKLGQETPMNTDLCIAIPRDLKSFLKITATKFHIPQQFSSNNKINIPTATVSSFRHLQENCLKDKNFNIKSLNFFNCKPIEADTKQFQHLMRIQAEILSNISSLSNNVTQKSGYQYLEKVFSLNRKLFEYPPLYLEACKLLSIYNFTLKCRRYILFRLFERIDFQQLYSIEGLFETKMDESFQYSYYNEICSNFMKNNKIS